MCGRLTENEVAVATVVWTDVRALPVIRVIPARNRYTYTFMHSFTYIHSVNTVETNPVYWLM